MEVKCRHVMSETRLTAHKEARRYYRETLKLQEYAIWELCKISKHLPYRHFNVFVINLHKYTIPNLNPPTPQRRLIRRLKGSNPDRCCKKICHHLSNNPFPIGSDCTLLVVGEHVESCGEITQLIADREKLAKLITTSQEGRGCTRMR